MRICQCEVPNEDYDPRRVRICVRCSCYIPKDWTLGNQTISEFFERLEAAMPESASDWFTEFRIHVEARELAGRKKFGYGHLNRDNARESQEELADAAIYFLCCILDQRRVGDHEEWELALTATKHAALAYQHSLALRRHEHTAFSDADLVRGTEAA